MIKLNYNIMMSKFIIGILSIAILMNKKKLWLKYIKTIMLGKYQSGWKALSSLYKNKGFVLFKIINREI